MNIENVERRAKGEERTVEAKMGGDEGEGSWRLAVLGAAMLAQAAAAGSVQPRRGDCKYIVH